MKFFLYTHIQSPLSTINIRATDFFCLITPGGFQWRIIFPLTPTLYSDIEMKKHPPFKIKVKLALTMNLMKIAIYTQIQEPYFDLKYYSYRFLFFDDPQWILVTNIFSIDTQPLIWSSVPNIELRATNWHFLVLPHNQPQKCNIFLIYPHWNLHFSNIYCSYRFLLDGDIT